MMFRVRGIWLWAYRELLHEEHALARERQGPRLVLQCSCFNDLGRGHEVDMNDGNTEVQQTNNHA